MIAPVVDLAWWQRHQDVVVADVRWYLDGRSGREAYERGHLPGAVFVDLDRWLAGKGGPAVGRHPLPEPEVFAEGMAQSGIAATDTVVAYDDAGGVIAARLVWMLRATGHDAALLDGGLARYQRPLVAGVVVRPRASFDPRPWPAARLAGIDDASDRSAIVIDARSGDRYRGELEPVDPRPGHIPGAYNVPCRDNLAADETFLPANELRRRFEDVGVVEAERVVSYCGSGVTACHNLLAMEYAGLGCGRLYPGSWSHYSHATGRAAATGDGRG